jgi:glycosyltransferase involved in cell wall biosynthesis
MGLMRVGYKRLGVLAKKLKEERMKILQISHGYNAPFLDVSNHYAAMLKKHGGVTTLYLSGTEDESVKRAMQCDKTIFWGLNSSQLKGAKLALILKLYKFIRDEEFDLVVCHRYKAIYMTAIVQLLGLKFQQIGVIHAFGEFKRAGRRIFLSLFKNRLKILGVSNAVRDDIRDSMPSFPASDIVTMYNAIDVRCVEEKQLSKEASRRHLGLDENAFIVGNVGRIHPDKDQATLIKAFAIFNKKAPDSQLVIMGEGRLKESLISLADSLNIKDKVLFLGQVPRAINYFKAFDLFALTSDKEPFGLVLLEAMVAKVPIIASNCGGAVEVVADKSCLFEFGNEHELSLMMLKFHQELDISDVIDSGYKKLHNFSIESTGKQLELVIK